MGKVRIDIPKASLKAVSGALQKWSNERDKEMTQTVRRYTLKVEASAKKRAPVDKGFLRRNIATQFGDREGLVIAKAKYSKFQEYGTGQRGAASNVRTPASYEYGSSRGIPAQPFMFPAFEEYREEFVRAIKALMRKL